MAESQRINAPRAYLGEQDLERMRQLLVRGQEARNGTFYIHPGDLDWWLYYLPATEPPWSNIFLWEEENNYETLAAWTLLSPDWRNFDVFIDPRWRGSLEAEQIYHWSEGRLTQILNMTGAPALHSMWADENDAWLRSILHRRGFSPSQPWLENMQFNLSELFPQAELPSGYRFQVVDAAEDIIQRALTQHSAFKSSLPVEEYCERYRRFVTTPAYTRLVDLIIKDPGGQIVAFCIFWPDPDLRVGLIEPFGVHPNFQRRGLGKALLSEAFRRLNLAGMGTAMLNVETDNYPAIHLYRSAGFLTACRLVTYTKPFSGANQ